jgi:hypothetical protein
MTITSLSRKERISGWVLCLALACMLAAPLWPAEAEAGLCKSVLTKCMGEAIVSGVLSGGTAFMYYATFCLVGYDFCQKYVERYV